MSLERLTLSILQIIYAQVSGSFDCDFGIVSRAKFAFSRRIVATFPLKVTRGSGVLVSVLCLLLQMFASQLMAQQAPVPAPNRPVPPLVSQPKALIGTPTARSMVGGFWMTDPNFKASIYLTNGVETSAVTATPVLYLSNGVKYSLPPVTLQPAGTSVLSINDALLAQGVAPYATLAGYVEVDYTWPWDPLSVSVTSIDTLHSVIFTSSVIATSAMSSNSAPTAMTPSAQTLEGMWWKQEANVSAFVALSNTSTQALTVNVVVTDSGTATLGQYSAVVSPHGTKTLDLGAVQSAASGNAGGLQVTYVGPAGAILINGGLQDQATGYSANLKFRSTLSATVTPSEQSYAELGLMVGAADPMMSFPVGTSFTPYSVLRNISDQSVSVVPTFYWMAGSAARSVQLPQLSLAPSQTIRLDMSNLLTRAALGTFSGSINLIMDAQEKPGALLMASGSVDGKNTYVFEVESEGIRESTAKSLAYWDTTNGDDTMVALWNPADEAQDFVLTMFYSGGHYNLPVHLEPRATRALEMSEVVLSQTPDAQGNVIPAGTHEGTAKISGTGGESQHILIALDAGTYNVKKATCNIRCKYCNGATAFDLAADPLAVTVNGTAQMTLTAQYNTGNQYDLTASSTWTSSNKSVATVNGGLVTGVSAGTMSLGADDGSVPDYGQVCALVPSCPAFVGGGGEAPGKVQLPTSLLFNSVTVLPNGPDPPDGCPASANYGIKIDITYQVLDQDAVPLQSAQMTPHESGTLFDGTPFDSNIGPVPGYPTSALNTAPNGTFHDVPFGLCQNLPIANPGKTATQNTTMILNGVSYPVRTQTWTVTAPSSGGIGHGHISNSVGDVSATR
jgi:Bacterial Ig-like domain (group 2)